MYKWLLHILIFATSGKYQNKEKPLKRQRKLGLILMLSSFPMSTSFLLPDPLFASIISMCTLYTPGCRMKAYKLPYLNYRRVL